MKSQPSLSGRSTLFFSSVVVCVYLLICLFTFILLQGYMHDWISFMHGEPSIALFFIYFTAAVIGIGLTLVFKKELQILKAPRKVLVISFLLTTIIGVYLPTSTFPLRKKTTLGCMMDCFTSRCGNPF